MVKERELKHDIYGLIYDFEFLVRSSCSMSYKSPKAKRSGALQIINVTMLNRSDRDLYRHAFAVGADGLDRAAVGFGNGLGDGEADTGAAGLRASGAVGTVEAVE